MAQIAPVDAVHELVTTPQCGSRTAGPLRGTGLNVTVVSHPTQDG
jgi:hypothetical protein